MDLILMGLRLVQTHRTMVQNILFGVFIPGVVVKWRLCFVVNGGYAFK